MKNKMTAWWIIMATSFLVIAGALWISFSLPADSNMMFNYVTGLVIGFSLMQTANILSLREEIQDLKTKLQSKGL